MERGEFVKVEEELHRDSLKFVFLLLHTFLFKGK